MIYGYARVSTSSQLKDGNSLEAQQNKLLENGVEKIYIDHYTGSKMNRPEFDLLIQKLKPGDTMIVTKLDRFARSFSHGSQLVTDLINKGIKVNVLNIGLMDNTPSSKLIRNIFFSFAEFERDMILERTQEGKSIAKLNPDFKEGRPRLYGKKQITHALELLDSKTYREVEELTGISKSTLIRAKKAVN